MGNFVPERRVNKNGVSVIKHVRADTKNGAPAVRIPAPMTDPAEANVRSRWEDVLNTAQGTHLAKQSNFHRLDNLVSLGEETVSRLEEVISVARTETDRQEITRLLRRHTTLSQVKARVNSLHAFRDLIGTDGKFDLNLVSASVVGLYPEPILLHAIDYSKPSLYSIARPKMELIAALYRSPVMRGFANQNPNTQFIEIQSSAVRLYPPLQTIATRNPGRTQAIIDIMVDRKMTKDDMPTLKNLLDGSESNALVEGVL